MAAFLRNLVLVLTAVTLLEHLLPAGPMGRMGRLVLGLALMYSLLSGFHGAADWNESFLTAGQLYQSETYHAIAMEGWEDKGGS